MLPFSSNSTDGGHMGMTVSHYNNFEPLLSLQLSTYSMSLHSVT